MKWIYSIIGLFFVSNYTFSQIINHPELEKSDLDSIYISEVEKTDQSLKLLHAEPLYIDLIRDLGARKGEKEWNIGVGLIDNNQYDRYEALVEYEWAPIDRLGLEIELPFSFHYPNTENANAPGNKLNGLKLAAQYTFLVNQKYNTSLALGYIHEFELAEFSKMQERKFHTGNIFNPFFIAAKRWGNNFHTLLYTGPSFNQHFYDKSVTTSWEINSNLHYMISGTRNFIGIEFNKEYIGNHFDIVIRPQMRVAIADNLLVGIVTGIPVHRGNQRFSSFLRLIYEPSHH